jgi:hypothetical protein
MRRDVRKDAQRSWEGLTMGIFMVLFILLLLAWIFSWAVFHVAGGLLHILLVLAIISLIVHFVRGSSRTV